MAPRREEGGTVSDTGSTAAARSSEGKGRTSPATFYRQVIAELRKVVYPTRPQVVNYFMVVLFFVLVMMAFVAGLDYGLGNLMFEIFA